jgi:hypothetical protein
MKLPGLNLQAIPAQRRVRKDTDLHQFLLLDQKNLQAAAAQWLHTLAPRALDEALKAGNPPSYVTEIDGATKGGRVTTGFRAGSIQQAKTAVRIAFTGKDLAVIANSLKPILLAVIRETFPNSRTRQLHRRWSWWVQRYGLLQPRGSRGASQRLGDFVPDTTSLYDILWLAPDAPAPAQYAWIANRNALRGIAGQAHRYNLTFGRGKRGKRSQARLRKRLHGYLAEATKRMRGSKAQQQQAAITIQGWIVKATLTGPAAISAEGRGPAWRYGVPVVRVAYRRGLKRPVSV